MQILGTFARSSCRARSHRISFVNFVSHLRVFSVDESGWQGCDLLRAYGVQSFTGGTAPSISLLNNVNHVDTPFDAQAVVF